MKATFFWAILSIAFLATASTTNESNDVTSFTKIITTIKDFINKLKIQRQI